MYFPSVLLFTFDCIYICASLSLSLTHTLSLSLFILRIVGVLHHSLPTTFFIYREKNGAPQTHLLHYLAYAFGIAYLSSLSLAFVVQQTLVPQRNYVKISPLLRHYI